MSHIKKQFTGYVDFRMSEEYDKRLQIPTQNIWLDIVFLLILAN